MFDTTTIANAQKASFSQLSGLSRQAVQGMEKLTALNVQVTRDALTEFGEQARAALAVKNPAEFATLQAAALQAVPEKALAYGREVKAILTEATAGQRAAAQAQFAEVQGKFVEAVNGLLKNAPGSEGTVALVKSAVDAANNAIATMTEAADQAVATVDANVESAVEASTKAERATRAKAKA